MPTAEKLRQTHNSQLSEIVRFCNEGVRLQCPVAQLSKVSLQRHYIKLRRFVTSGCNRSCTQRNLSEVFSIRLRVHPGLILKTAFALQHPRPVCPGLTLGADYISGLSRVCSPLCQGYRGPASVS